MTHGVDVELHEEARRLSVTGGPSGARARRRVVLMTEPRDDQGVRR